MVERDRAIEITAQREQLSPANQHKGCTGCQLLGTIGKSLCLVQVITLAALEKEHRQLHQSLRVVWIEFETLSVALDGWIAPIEVDQRPGELILPKRAAVELSLAIVQSAQRLVQLSEFSQLANERQLCLDVVRSGFRCLTKAR